MPVASSIWVPYPTTNNPIAWSDLPEWDSIVIAGVTLPIQDLPAYSRKLGIDRKSGPGQDYYGITSKGVKPEPFPIVLKLWLDVNTGKNYLDEYRKLINKIIAPNIERRYSVPIYHPALQPFGVTTAVFTDVGGLRHVGNLIFNATLQALDGRTQNGNGKSKKELKAPDTTAATTVNQTHQIFLDRTGQNRLLPEQTIPLASGPGQIIAGTMQSRVNTPASRASIP